MIGKIVGRYIPGLSVRQACRENMANKLKAVVIPSDHRRIVQPIGVGKQQKHYSKV
jgi:hypothetical protein